MKFTKEQAVEKLNELLTNSGKKPLRMSKKTLESQTETLMAFVTDEELELDAFVEKVRPSLENINSNLEKDQADFIKSYKDKNPKKDVDPKPGEPKTEYEEMRERLKVLEERENQRTRESALKTKRGEIEKYLSDNNVKDGAWIEKTLGMISISEDEDTEAKGSALVELYNLSHKGDPSLTPQPPKPGDPDITDFGDLKTIMKQKISINS